MSKKEKWYRCICCGVMLSEKELIDGKCPYCRTSNIKETVPDVVLVKEKKKSVKVANRLTVIEPYWYQNTWVFDDEAMGLKREPLDGRLEGLGELEDQVIRWLSGASRMINFLVKDIPNARKGFMLLLSSQPFAGYQVELTRSDDDEDDEEASGGCSYKVKDWKAGWWLSPTLLRHFDIAPESIYVKAEPHLAKYDQIREVVTLRDRVEKLEQMVGKLTLENEAVRKGRNK